MPIKSANASASSIAGQDSQDASLKYVSPEAQLVGILNALHSVSRDPTVAVAARNELVLWCENHLRRNLKAILFKTFGPQVTHDGSLRFTALWNDVLAKALRSSKLEFRNEDVLKSLTSYFSVALANRALDYLRKRKRREKHLNDEIKTLVEQRERHLMQTHQIDFGVLLETAMKWEKAGLSIGTILRLRYVDGLSYEEIGNLTGKSRDQVKYELSLGRSRLSPIATNLITS
ncbi:MAG: RNA polymerase sigma factor [Planctomycetota bacterium]|jgi:RNA polymerase sigma factor (sigma-70 family)